MVSFPELIKATVVSRPNRFLIKAMVNGIETDVHIHDPGRLKELIYPGNNILIRKTKILCLYLIIYDKYLKINII